MKFPLPAFSVVVVLLAGCAGLGDGDRSASGTPPADPPAPADAPVPAESTVPAEPPPARSDEVVVRDLGKIVELLQDGRNKEARAALVAYLQREPGSHAAKSLLQQLDTDPVALLGAAHTTYTVQPGDTLGGLAARYLGDATRFVALARYNGIGRPRTLQVGQTLKIPSERAGAAAAGTASAASAAPAAPGSAEEHRQRIESALAAGRIEAAVVAVEQAQAHRPANGGWDGWLDPLARRAFALQHQQRGMGLMKQGRHEAAHDAFKQALAQWPELQPAGRHFKDLRKRLVSGYHEAAVVHYRNQRLDEAIALWDKALEMDPAFEPARGYRTRALELKRRLQELGGR